ncbi:hypothetical protein CH370_08095 [Leptospira kmetyi]|uniref:hypothetical protein n=1 Tax=Leptospira kmetyi TaxID=408139 RepID=UPI000C29BA1F|nr:hypothetical protein [Leptospira kmetyi]PJZ42188.1 hypothetical protein CH370_08095 [Leptospira kmetyi]
MRGYKKFLIFLLLFESINSVWGSRCVVDFDKSFLQRADELKISNQMTGFIDSVSNENYQDLSTFFSPNFTYWFLNIRSKDIVIGFEKAKRLSKNQIQKETLIIHRREDEGIWGYPKNTIFDLYRNVFGKEKYLFIGPSHSKERSQYFYNSLFFMLKGKENCKIFVYDILNRSIYNDYLINLKFDSGSMVTFRLDKQTAKINAISWDPLNVP